MEEIYQRGFLSWNEIAWGRYKKSPLMKIKDND